MEENKQKIQDKEIYFREKILEFIHKIEKEKDVIIIYACETGSRGWGTHVKDSDFDIKGYFICSREKYLSIPVKFLQKLSILHINYIYRDRLK